MAELGGSMLHFTGKAITAVPSKPGRERTCDLRANFHCGLEGPLFRKRCPVIIRQGADD